MDIPITLEVTASGKKIIRYNASAIKESECQRRTYLTVAGGYTERLNNNDVEFGSAFHLFASEMERTNGDSVKSLAAATKYYAEKPMIMKSNKTYLDKKFLQSVCMEWLTFAEGDRFKVLRDSNSQPIVEIKFAYPYYADDEVEVILCGTIDRVGKFDNGIYAFGDYKTTAVYKIEEYLKSYLMSPQMLFYRLIIRKYAAFGGIWEEVNKLPVGCFIDGLFHKAPPKTTGGTGIEIVRSDVMVFSDVQLAEFERLLDGNIHTLIRMVKAGKLPDRYGMLYGSCETKYGNCKYWNACTAPTDLGFQTVMKHSFIQRPYDPLNL